MGQADRSSFGGHAFGGHGQAREDRVERALQEVWALLMQVMGENYLDEVPITLRTALRGDLELESLEFVLLAEELQRRHPELDFVSWLAGMEVMDLVDLELGQLVQFVAEGADPV